jgi:hypothetical protein
LEVTQDISMHSEQGVESDILPWLQWTVSKEVAYSVYIRL